jgi:hypothetical protein
MCESGVIGWKEIAKIFGVSLRKAKSWRADLIHLRVIFYMRVGRPPRTFACAFPSELVKWAAFRGMMKEIL